MNHPYIGVTGFMNPNEVLEVLTGARMLKRLIMIGVLVSQKTLAGKTNRWPNRYPPPHKIAEIFPASDRTLNLIHYNTDSPDSLKDQVNELIKVSGPNCHGLQLNVAWPPLWQIRQIKVDHPNLAIVLQIGNRAIDQVGHQPESIVDRVCRYTGYIDYVLVDPSGGYGQFFDLEQVKEILLALQVACTNIGLGLAGGLSMENVVNNLRPLSILLPNLSIDAEGRLRDKNDHLDCSQAIGYLCSADAMFNLVSC